MTDGALIGLALGNAIADSTFRDIIGVKLLADENKVNDGIGMALLMNNSNPIVKPASPMYTSILYKKNY